VSGGRKPLCRPSSGAMPWKSCLRWGFQSSKQTSSFAVVEESRQQGQDIEGAYCPRNASLNAMSLPHTSWEGKFESLEITLLSRFSRFGYSSAVVMRSSGRVNIDSRSEPSSLVETIAKVHEFDKSPGSHLAVGVLCFLVNLCIVANTPSSILTVFRPSKE
jgi:hypothetical protein